MRKLESYRVPRRFHGRAAPIGAVDARLGPVFRDRDELPTTSDLGEKIRETLRDSSTLIVICSPNSARSHWVEEEITTFKRLHGGQRVFAFIVSGEPKFAGSQEDCFSPALRADVDADGTFTPSAVEVVAADARAQCDGRKLAFLRLVAGLLGVGFDDLRQRELQRRNRRLSLIATASVLGMTVTLALAITAWRERSEAILARNDAQRRQNQAEDVLTFMVGDFRNELKKLGRLSLLDAVGDKATAYFDALDPRDLSDKSLVSQTRALTQIGENRMDQARYPEAARAFATAYNRAATLAARQPRDGEALFWRAQAEYWVGFVHWKRGNLAQASEWLTRYRNSGDLLVSLDPSQATWQGELAYSHHNLAVLDMERGNFSAARGGFTDELALLTRMSAAKSTDLELRFRITDINSWLGSLAEQAGQLEDAEQRFAAQSQGLEKLLEIEPQNARWKVKLADAWSFRSNLRAITGRSGEALELRRSARSMVDALVAQDPANRGWLIAAYSIRLREALLLDASGKSAAAAALASDVRHGFEKLSAAEPTARAITAQLAMACELEAQTRDRTEQPEAAAVAERAVALGKTLVSASPSNQSYLGEYVKANVTLGLIAEHRGDHGTATRAWQTALAAVQPSLASSNYWRVLDPAARAFALLGQAEESHALVERLTQLGYQPLKPWP